MYVSHFTDEESRLVETSLGSGLYLRSESEPRRHWRNLWVRTGAAQGEPSSSCPCQWEPSFCSGAQEDTSHPWWPSLPLRPRCINRLWNNLGSDSARGLFCWSVQTGWGCLVEPWKDIMSDKHVACQSPDDGVKHRLWTLIPEASQMTELGCLSCRQHLLVVILV